MNAREWLAQRTSGPPDIALIGVPVSRLSISPSQAWSTPPALRTALQRFPTWNAEHGVDLATLAVHDRGDVDGDRDDADTAAVRARIESAARASLDDAGLTLLVGGDNSLTVPAMRGSMAARPHETWGLLTLDAHHDCRPLDDGPRNGTPVRELIESGLPASRVVQVGIHPLGNHEQHARWAMQHGITVFSVRELRALGTAPVIERALRHLRDQRATAIYVDIDIDCVDRAFAPACPASLPGGLLPTELLQAAHLIARDPRVAVVDFTEVDANADVAAITVRLLAATLLDVCAGFARRSGREVTG
ncbi:MAG: arginase family protein [Candidatus Dormibacteria bacterium]